MGQGCQAETVEELCCCSNSSAKPLEARGGLIDHPEPPSVVAVDQDAKLPDASSAGSPSPGSSPAKSEKSSLAARSDSRPCQAKEEDEDSLADEYSDTPDPETMRKIWTSVMGTRNHGRE
eukprot:gnl/TRDRNA2_/TRDRNA2_80607_c0_seq1.p1 gnl/TRDRNA2_/TRDRNA2_80607_c0~~gnl/TRDRNA2_/TRDRNA2_80607_c0_seq1.p1  ORF type:complete len:120 (+),score=24.62 gnl/TRDRNA2_/TRDRNA2_80607_c0_seq1:59-418(+)